MMEGPKWLGSQPLPEKASAGGLLLANGARTRAVVCRPISHTLSAFSLGARQVGTEKILQHLNQPRGLRIDHAVIDGL